MRRILFLVLFSGALLHSIGSSAQDFTLGPEGYFRNEGIDIMAFYDFYPEGHQGGVCVIMNGNRVATNGDLRFEATPGQWQPVPRQISREVGKDAIVARLSYPDSSRHLTGFNPMVYPDAVISYTVTTRAVGDHIEVTLDLDSPIPDAFIGKAGFNLEFFPGTLFGKPWIMDGKSGIYPRQPNAPVVLTEPNYRHTGSFHQEGKPIIDFDRLIAEGKGYNPIVADDIIAQPYAIGRKFTSRPDDPYSKLTIETLTGDLKLYDGRMNHNNGWFVLRSEIPSGATKGAVKWIITPAIVPGWRYSPVIQTSQVGYHPAQRKIAVIELDGRDSVQGPAELVRIDADGPVTVLTAIPEDWGRFLRFNYACFDFSDVRQSGLYKIRYGGSESSVFRIGEDIYRRGIWQPVIEYFLPNQMCHMRVNEKYRVWHDACHLDDARMARNENGIDGYNQEPGISPYAPGAFVPGIAAGGWHDAGDLDLRIESQAGESYILSLAYEQFSPDIDVTAIDFERRVTEIHQPDGRNDILQQIENGVMSVVSAYKALGRPYRGIISSSLRQYVILGDAAAMTDGVPGNEDDRWIYTECNPSRDRETAAQLAGAARVLRGYDSALATQCLDMSRALFSSTEGNRMHSAVELFLTTGEKTYRDYILDNKEEVLGDMGRCAWFFAAVAKGWENSRDRKERAFAKEFREALLRYRETLRALVLENPYGVPYHPSIWGAGWDIQRFGYEHYFLVSAYPDIFSPDPVLDALHFVLGRHPGSNTASFASGVGAVSATTAYGTTRADWSYVPGGVISGTAIIRPDLPELLEFPYLWQQTEYVLGGGSSHYMFLVLAAEKLLQSL